MNLKVDNFLAHYGVKGMKWGVRRDDEEIRIEKGTTLKNISVGGARESSDATYVSYTDKDNLNYRGNYSVFMKSIHGPGVQLYDNTYKLNAELVSPSKQKRVEEFKSLYTDDPAGVARSIARVESILAVHRGMKITKMNSFEAKRQKEIVKKGREALSEADYLNFSTSLVNKNANPMREAYFDRLKKQGYNSLVDDNDLGNRGAKSQEPLIVIDPAAISRMSSVKLSDNDIRLALSEYRAHN